VALPVLLADVAVAAVSGQALPTLVTSVASMTAIALFTKLLHAAMLSVALLAFGRTFAGLFGVRAARWGVPLCMVNLSVAYYGRVTNVAAGLGAAAYRRSAGPRARSSVARVMPFPAPRARPESAPGPRFQ
jgi:hypothetical protein